MAYAIAFDIISKHLFWLEAAELRVPQLLCKSKPRLMELNDAQRARVEQSRAAALARKAAMQEAICLFRGLTSVNTREGGKRVERVI